MPIDRLFKKAKKLLESRRVEPLDQGVYNVIGYHGTYTVAQDYSGNVSCNCPGFRQNRRCSHAMAVLILTMPKGERGRRAKKDKKTLPEKDV